MKKMISIVILLCILVAAGIAAKWVYQNFLKEKKQTVYTTQTVSKNDMKQIISATGTVEPEELVNVGAQVGGMIETFGMDASGKRIDYCSPVKAGMVLANIDAALYDAEVKQADAEVKQAKAAIHNAEALIKQAEVKFQLANTNWTRAQKLYSENIMAKSDYDSYQTEQLTAQAEKTVSEARLLTAQAELAGAEATYQRAKRNLEYCVIKSPVDGIIIDRRVNIGQTVVSSMSAPSLFLIAKDLKRMQVWVSVNEADIGSIKIGLPVEFTVDSFPGRTFTGEVQKIRLNATMSQNVVTYVVEIGTDNSNGILLPYLTANVDFILEQRKQALTIPNAAFRFTPEEELIPKEFRTAKPGEQERLIWVKDGKTIRPIPVKSGLNDGTNTEILSGTLQENMEVITGAKTMLESELKKEASAEDSAKSPFLPTPPKMHGSKKK